MNYQTINYELLAICLTNKPMTDEPMNYKTIIHFTYCALYFPS